MRAGIVSERCCVNESCRLCQQWLLRDLWFPAHTGRPLSAKQLLTGEAVAAPLAADALYTALDDLMARAGALSAERRCAFL